jgi:hypothetical protein
MMAEDFTLIEIGIKGRQLIEITIAIRIVL